MRFPVSYYKKKKNPELMGIDKAHVGNTYAVAYSHSKDILFSVGEDGAIHMLEVRSWFMDDGIRSVATWIPHTDLVYALVFEFPWLVSSSGNGKLALITVRKLLKCSQHRLWGGQHKVNRASNIIEPNSGNALFAYQNQGIGRWCKNCTSHHLHFLRQWQDLASIESSHRYHAHAARWLADDTADYVAAIAALPFARVSAVLPPMTAT